jgi:anti-anti-sigma regulatory factor
MSVNDLNPGSSGFPVSWSGRFAVMRPTADLASLTATALAGELCAVLDAGAAGLTVELSSAGACDSASLDALMRTARRARGWGSWLRLVVPDADARKVVRLVALGGVMPVHASVTAAAAAEAQELAAAGGG